MKNLPVLLGLGLKEIYFMPCDITLEFESPRETAEFNVRSLHLKKPYFIIEARTTNKSLLSNLRLLLSKFAKTNSGVKTFLSRSRRAKYLVLEWISELPESESLLLKIHSADAYLYNIDLLSHKDIYRELSEFLQRYPLFNLMLEFLPVAREFISRHYSALIS